MHEVLREVHCLCHCRFSQLGWLWETNGDSRRCLFMKKSSALGLPGRHVDSAISSYADSINGAASCRRNIGPSEGMLGARGK